MHILIKENRSIKNIFDKFMKGIEKMKRKNKKEEVPNLIEVNNLIDYNQKLEDDDKTFERLMYLYSAAIKELQTKVEIIKDEFKIFYNYDLIDHINTRIKTPESIKGKMQKRNLELNYKEMIENINDIAGIRIICPLKKDIFSIRNLIEKLPEVSVLTEKDYVTHPKESGYSSYHIIVEIPVTLSQNIVYVKVEIQIRTIAMDFWASLEHKMKYKPEEKIDKKSSKEWVSCAKVIQKLDNKMMLLNS